MLNFLSSWILSIIGIVFIGVLSDILLPNGKMQNVVKTVVSLFTILIILKPISKFDFNNLNFSSFDDIYPDNSFIETYEENKLDKLKIDIKNSLAESGYNQVELEIERGENNSIKTIYVDLNRLVILENMTNINKYTNIIAIIKQFVNIDREQIIFYE